MPRLMKKSNIMVILGTHWVFLFIKIQSGLCFEITAVNPHGSKTIIEVVENSRLAKGSAGGGVSIRYGNSQRGRKPLVTERTYSDDVLKELKRIWGEREFDVSHWSSDVCGFWKGYWSLASGGKRVYLCDPNRSEFHRIVRLQNAIQALMSVSDRSRP